MKSFWNTYKEYRGIAILVTGLLVLLFAGSGILARTAVLLIRAAPSSVISLSDSYVIGAQLLAVADGKEEVKVSVFLRDSSGKPISNKMVSVFGLSSMEDTPVATDESGKAVFSGTSKIAGQFTILAQTDAGQLPGKVVVTFK